MSDTVVVCGGGVAGLVVGRLLAGSFDKVILVEAREFNGGQAPRSEVPQSRHVHHILSYGYEQLARIFPTFQSQLLTSGAERLDHSKEVAFFGGSGLYPQRDFGIAVASQTRALIDRILWAEVMAIDNIEVVSGAKILGVERCDSGSIRKVNARVDGNLVSLQGEVFVDCTGAAASRTWYGCSTATSDARYFCDVDLHYRSFETPRFSFDNIRERTRGLVVSPTRNDARFLVIMPIENGNYLVTAGGKNSDTVLMDSSLPNFIQSICVDRGIELDCGHYKEPSRISRLSQLRLYWNRFANWDDLPNNLFPVGDAFATLSPLAGQGISLAIKHAISLATIIPDSPDPQSAYLALSHAAVEPCWLLAVARESITGKELSAPAGTSDRVALLLELERSAYSDPIAHRRALLFRHYLGGQGL